MGFSKATAAVYLLALSALGSAEVTTTSTGTSTSTKAIHSITTTTTTTSRTITHTSATIPAGRTSTSHESVPGVTHIPDSAIILSVERKHESQDSPETLFISASTPFLTPSCASASAFNLTSSRLSLHGHPLSTTADIVFQPLTTTKFPSALDGRMGIDTGFSVEDGYLRWYNGRFYGGRARYCVTGGGMVNVVFHVSKTWPEGCEEVDLRVWGEGECGGDRVVEGGRIGEGDEVRTTGVESMTPAAAGWDEL
ncbi:uncharacterized protein GGS22DRAFT_194952 [Annulohypoxylon maeteangense]|uniref:uncharacterized protein n=1 Tax=Annulohypoxylon maeteangense TaxID=1927788 RepID=UPI002008DA81|nr:uncharacterized protein GGS22DRAFT_194952 [Annulohypoxylon maeteangense]KAI0883710.1 hypothetical protein GGS22DRAFT_194952 [Annulohypoxylon maeteangense]